jgi:hypothetical protein
LVLLSGEQLSGLRGGREEPLEVERFEKPVAITIGNTTALGRLTAFDIAARYSLVSYSISTRCKVMVASGGVQAQA